MNSRITVAIVATWMLGTIAVAHGTEPERSLVASRDTGAAYLTGGVGLDQRESLAALAKHHNLKLVFARQGIPPAHNAFVAMVSVRILDQEGKEIFAANDAGPWLFTTLAGGTYRVEATLAGRTMTQTVKVVEGRQTQLAFLW